MITMRLHLRSLLTIQHTRRRYTTASTQVTPPFSRSSLDSIRKSLESPPFHSPNSIPSHTVSSRRTPNEAAILIPLLNIQDQPCILLEVRSSKLRIHAGEISFPGGKVDPTDESLVHTALREAEEELALPSKNVEILGMLQSPEYSLGNRARVWPFVGFIHKSPSWSHPTTRSTAQTLPSLPLPTLKPSPDEVAALLPLPVAALSDPNRQSLHFFRSDASKPYLKIRVGDLCQPRFSGMSDLEVWGLSGWFLNRLAWRLGWMSEVDIPFGEE